MTQIQPAANLQDTPKRPRVASIDTLRGIIMLVMAIDHTRDFFHQPAMLYDPLNLDITTVPIFFTRWITHFCAPIFVFLSGISAFISGQRKTTAQLSSFLVKRGIWLIIVELVIVSFGITYDPTYSFFVLQVIWAIGWSMVILGLLVRTSYTIVIIVGAILFFGHNIFDFIDPPKSVAAEVTLRLLFTSPGSILPLWPGHLALVAYAILPWTAIMLLGYGFGKLYSRDFDAARRRKILLMAGAGLMALFILLRLIKVYGDPGHWSEQRNFVYSILSFINVTKYPVSLQYSCLTLGTACLFLAVMENVRNGFTRFVSVYGSVPFFYYILHFYLIHLLCMIAFFISGYGWDQAFNGGTPFAFRPIAFGYPLWGMYLVWLLVILILYYPCRWFSKYKREHSDWWLSYL